jgi:hypothetical protein
VCQGNTNGIITPEYLEATSDGRDDDAAQSGEERGGPLSKRTEQKDNKIAKQRGQSRASFVS